jgi:hypothetical protein
MVDPRLGFQSKALGVVMAEVPPGVGVPARTGTYMTS